MAVTAPSFAASCGPHMLTAAKPERPACCDVSLRAESHVSSSASPISKDALRSLCQPFIEQMLHTMQDGIATALKTSGMESPSVISTSASESPSSTPEWWGVRPSYFDMVSATTPDVPVEVLRSMCAPFIEQMLHNVEEGVSSYLEGDDADTGSGATVDSPTPDCGHADAFGALLSMRSVEINLCEQLELATPNEPTFPSSAEDRRGRCQTWHHQSSPIVWADEEPETFVLSRKVAAIPQRKLMICRHWQAKGFCRLGDGCKFLHPENGRGEHLANSSEESRSSRSRKGRDRRCGSM